MDDLLREAATLGLFRPHGASEVHCANCHARLNPRGDCDTCGLIGRSVADQEQRARTDPAALERLRAAIAKRRVWRPQKVAREP
jgi:predicted amidophosphoribosyltransferase